MQQLPSAAIAAMAAKARRVPERPHAFWAVTSKDQRMRLIEDLRARLEGERDDTAARSLNEWIRVLSR